MSHEHHPDALAKEREAIAKMAQLGWESEQIPGIPEHVGRFFKRVGRYEIDIERLMGGEWYVAAYDCEGTIGPHPELIGEKERYANFMLALVRAFSWDAYAQAGHLEIAIAEAAKARVAPEAERETAL